LVFAGPKRFPVEFSRAYVYVKPSGGWSGTMTETATLKARHAPSHGYASLLGRNVAIDGDTVVAGNKNDRNVCVFQKPTGGWAGTVFERVRLSTPDLVPGMIFTERVAIQGRTIIVAGVQTDPAASPGAAYVYVRPESGWRGDVAVQTAKLLAPVSATAAFPGSVSVSGDTVAVGDADHVYVYVRPGSEWIDSSAPAATLTARLPGVLGGGVVSGDRITGGGVDVVDSVSRRVAFIFKRPVGGWSGSLLPTRRLLMSDPNAILWAVDADAKTTVLGSASQFPPSGGEPNRGKAYVFEFPGN
jgi:hypothetical protein